MVVRVLYDHSIFGLQSHGGISRYFTELIRHSAGLWDADLSCLYTNNANLLSLGLRNVQQAETQPIPPVGQIRRTWHKLLGTKPAATRRYDSLLAANQENLGRLARSGRFDLIHFTYFDQDRFAQESKLPYILTVHDLIHEQYPEFFSLDDETRFQRERMLQGAARVIAISEQTKRDLLSWYAVKADRITVVPHGTNLSAAGTGASRILPLEENWDYLLFTGERGQYKNFHYLAPILIEIMNRFPGLRLVCTGKPLTRSEATFLGRLGAADRVWAGNVDDATLRVLYEHAAVFLFPSQCEGFGMPLLEAMEAGCPVVASDIPVFHEVACDSALFAGVKDTRMWKQSIISILENDELRHLLVGRGRKRSAEFSWEQTAKATSSVYRAAVETI